MNRKLLSAIIFSILHASILSTQGEARDPWKDQKVRVGDIKMRYIEAGEGDRTLVFIPGWTMTADVWREQIPYFTSRGFRVIALDPRSHGETSKTDTGNTYQQQAADLYEFLDNLDIEDASLIGWSSGVVALLEYISSPEALQPDAIVLVDGSPAVLKVDDFPGLMTMQQARRLWLNFQEDRNKAADTYVRTLLKQTHRGSLYEDLAKASVKTPLHAAYSLFIDLLTGDRRSTLEYITVPTLILTTSENLAVGEYMKSKISQAELEVIEGAGSAMFLDKPQAFNQALESFLEGY
jgi:non-heme chloroperoxidase